MEHVQNNAAAWEAYRRDLALVAGSLLMKLKLDFCQGALADLTHLKLGANKIGDD